MESTVAKSQVSTMEEDDSLSPTSTTEPRALEAHIFSSARPYIPDDAIQPPEPVGQTPPPPMVNFSSNGEVGVDSLTFDKSESGTNDSSTNQNIPSLSPSRSPNHLVSHDDAVEPPSPTGAPTAAMGTSKPRNEHSLLDPAASASPSQEVSPGNDQKETKEEEDDDMMFGDFSAAVISPADALPALPPPVSSISLPFNTYYASRTGIDLSTLFSELGQTTTDNIDSLAKFVVASPEDATTCAPKKTMEADDYLRGAEANDLESNAPFCCEPVHSTATEYVFDAVALETAISSELFTVAAEKTQQMDFLIDPLGNETLGVDHFFSMVLSNSNPTMPLLYPAVADAVEVAMTSTNMQKLWTFIGNHNEHGSDGIFAVSSRPQVCPVAS
eukprot:GHVT01005507.1.p1 GENE.GHVT01005507.1~~GHVT01005507.1.p1  ORF type:complete len:386 (+),score=58.07 GHVT01005507.1:435-1592(+)